MVLCVVPLRLTNAYLRITCTSYKGPSPHRDDRATAQRTDSQRGCGTVQLGDTVYTLLCVLFRDDTIGAIVGSVIECMFCMFDVF